MPENTTDTSSRLLYVLSTRGEMSWRSFKEIFDALYTVQSTRQDSASPYDDKDRESRFPRNQTVTVLNALAHCDFDFKEGGGRVYVAPPVLARLPRAGLPQAVLCGARSPQTCAQLEAACAAQGALLEWETQPASLQSSAAFTPPRVVVQATTTEDLEAVACLLDIHCRVQPPAWELLYHAGSLDALLDSSRPIEASNLKGWRRKDFDPRTLSIKEPLGRKPNASNETINTQLIRYTHPRTKASRNYLAKDDQFTPLGTDWEHYAWGRYAVLRAAGYSVLAYDERSFHLAAPIGAPLPRLLARSLALCSGYAPHFLPRRAASWNSPEPCGFNVYRWIPPQIARMVAEKLGQVLLRQEIKAFL
jgi:hypothetical protein